jgi:CRP-like cAMP-binding protein
MATRKVKRYRNKLLARLTEGEQRILVPALVPVELPVRHPIESSGKTVRYVYFPEDGIISVVAQAARNGIRIEAGIIGYEGMTGSTILLNDGRAPYEAYVQVPGIGFRIPSAAFHSALAQSQTLRERFLRFAQTFSIQIAHTALANGRAKIDQRLARWLLMAHDRLTSDGIPLTHEFLALMLGVRRAGVTRALHKLRERSLIRMLPGVVVILHRANLEDYAEGYYGVPEGEYRRLMGSRLGR